MQTIFRNSEENVYLNEDVGPAQIEQLLKLAEAKNTKIFSERTKTWASVYWNANEKAICGCWRVMPHLPDRKRVTFEEFQAEIIKPEKGKKK
jgi:hypothetical protein